MKKKARSTPCSHAEFESLPEPLRRKYFSSLERLRIAEEHALHELQGDGNHIVLPSRAKSTTVLRSSRRRLRRAETIKRDRFLAHADASFFLSLPPKVQRSAFSREEQTLLLASCDHAPLPTASPPRLHRDEAQRLRDFRFGFDNTLRSDPGHTAHDSRANEQHLEQHPDPFSRSGSPSRGRTLRRGSSPSSTAVSPTRRSPYAATQELHVDTESSSLLYLDTMSPLSSQPSRASFRRTLSLTNIPLSLTNYPLRTSTSSAPLPPESLSARGTAPWHQRAHSQSISGRSSSHAPVAPVFDPEATHYRDAETRKKLQFLASPQKFDEAVEFGFPSSNGDDMTPSRYQLPPISTDARNFSRDMQSFLKDDRVSFLEDHEEDNKGLDSDADDADSIAEVDSPVTPSSAGLDFRYHARKQSSNFSSSMDSTGLPLIHPVTGRLNREMTLRMTLTRPDLRADEEQLYGWQGQKGLKDDPFALEDLPLSDDMNGTKGPFYVKPKTHGNLVTRLFKRGTRKGR